MKDRQVEAKHNMEIERLSGIYGAEVVCNIALKAPPRRKVGNPDLWGKPQTSTLIAISVALQEEDEPIEDAMLRVSKMHVDPVDGLASLALLKTPWLPGHAERFGYQSSATRRRRILRHQSRN